MQSINNSSSIMERGASCKENPIGHVYNGNSIMDRGASCKEYPIGHVYNGTIASWIKVPLVKSTL